MDELPFIRDVLEDAAEMVRDRRPDRTAMGVSEKREAADLLTQVDLDVEQRIERTIRSAFPGDTVVAEERAATHVPTGDGERAWVLDPIDGTHNFVRGLLPAYGISLAFAVGGEPVAGGVAIPDLRELLLAEQGTGALRNGRAMAVSAEATLERAKIEVDMSRPSKRTAILQGANEVLDQAGQIRSHGSAAVALCAVACGDAEAFIHSGLHPWDYAAGMLLVREADGRATHWDGRPLTLATTGGVLATNGVLHEELLRRVGTAEAAG